MRERAVRMSLAATATVAAAFAAHTFGANATTAALLLNFAVVLASMWGRFATGAAAAVVAGLAFNFLFLPPYGTLHIERAEDLLTFVLFLGASALTSRIVTLSLEREEEAKSRAAEVDTLYRFAVNILESEAHGESLETAIRSALQSIGAGRGGYLEFEQGEPRPYVWFGAGLTAEELKRVRSIRVHQQSLSYQEAEGSTFYAPVKSGSDIARGVVVISGSAAARVAVEAVSTLIALAFEREDLAAARMHVETLREGEQLRTSFFRAVSHDLTTPLASILLHTESLQRLLRGREETKSAVENILQEAARLRRRIQNLLSIARLEAGKIRLSPEPTPPADLFRSARENLGMVFQSRPFEVSIGEECDEVFADPLVATEVLTNLIENADRASPAARAIELVAERAGAAVRLGVLDRGAGLASLAGSRMDLDDVPHKGLGLEIVRSFVELGGGAFSIEAREGGGTAAWVSFPAGERSEHAIDSDRR